MKKSTLIHELSKKTGLSYAAVDRVVNGLIDIVTDSITEGEPVILPGFGIFEAKSRMPRIGRSVHTGEAVEIPARVMPYFRPSRPLIEKVSCPAVECATESLRNPPSK